MSEEIPLIWRGLGQRKPSPPGTEPYRMLGEGSEEFKDIRIYAPRKGVKGAAVLAFLTECPDQTATAKELAIALGKDRQNIAYTVRRLAKNGLIHIIKAGRSASYKLGKKCKV